MALIFVMRRGQKICLQPSGMQGITSLKTQKVTSWAKQHKKETVNNLVERYKNLGKKISLTRNKLATTKE